jgi:hypothetical protein
VSARTGPPDKVRAPGLASGGAEVERLGGGFDVRTLPRAVFVARLLDLGRRYGELPIYGSGEWERLPADDPRRFASVVRAAECWRLDSEPEAVRQRLAEDDWLVRYRVRAAGLDVHGRGSTDWPRIHEVVTARAAYRERWGVPA